MQPYLSPKNAWDNQLSKFIFQARTRMLDLRANFKMEHVKTGLEYEDLFATEVEKQMKMAAILKERFLKRKVLLKQN